MNRTAKRLLVNLVGSTVTADHKRHWSRLEAAGFVEVRPITAEAQHIIRTADGDTEARRLKREDPSLIAGDL